jgi:hypothetical protein
MKFENIGWRRRGLLFLPPLTYGPRESKLPLKRELPVTSHPFGRIRFPFRSSRSSIISMRRLASDRSN